MKILFTADLHIKVGQKNVPRAWQLNRYYKLFEELRILSEEVDVVVLGGDIFDTAPTLEELALFMDYVRDSTCLHIIYDGNHEATKKGQTFFKYIYKIIQNNNFVGITGITNYMGIDFVPYTHINKIKDYQPKSNILCTHIRGEILPHVKPEIDLDLLNKWDVVLSGDLHAYSNSQRNILYPGSPLSINFHRNPITNGVIIFDTDTLEHEWIDLKLPQLIRKTVQSKDDIQKTKVDHTIYEIEGNIADLSGIDISSDLVDKKLVRKDNDSILELTENMTVLDELRVYWRKVLKLSESDIENLEKVYNDNNKGTEMG